MSDTSNTDAATDLGSTKAAGEGLSDADAVTEVANQTSSDLKAEDLFERESGGAMTDKPAAETTADDLEAN
jgi:protease I